MVVLILNNVFNIQFGSQDAYSSVSFANSFLKWNIGLVQSKGYFAQFKYSKGLRRNKMYKGVPLEWLLFKLYFKMAPLISTFHSRMRKLVYT